MIVVKRISCFIALVCALLMGTASCSDDAVDIDEYTKQTLFVYMPWSGSETSSGLYSYFQVNLDSIERAIKRDKGLVLTELGYWCLSATLPINLPFMK